jgi:hypothetical protein
MVEMSLSDALRPLTTRLNSAVREHEILRVSATIGLDLDIKAVELARTEILKWAARKTGTTLPKEAWDHRTFDHLAGGRNCSAVRISDDARDIWAIRSEDPDKNVARRIWTAEAVIGFQKESNARAQISLRLLANSTESELSIEPSVPAFIRRISAIGGLYRGKIALHTNPRYVTSEEAADELIDLLLDRSRSLPIVVLSVHESAKDQNRPLIDPMEFAFATTGLALTFILPSRFTWNLTERLGKRLSVFGGAARIYLPGFSEDSDPHSGHELILAENLISKDGAARAAIKIRRIVAVQSIRQTILDKTVLSFSAVRRRSLDIESEQQKRSDASDADQLRTAEAIIKSLQDELRQALATQQWISDEHHATEERAKVAESGLAAAGYRIQQLIEQIKSKGESPDANIPLPSHWAEFSEWCEQYLVGRVQLTPRARREVKSSLFNDVQLAARCLLWLGNEYLDRRRAGGDGDLRVQLEAGILNERCGADSFDIDWQGNRRQVDWHIKNGGNTRSPERCLRIYYLWDEQNEQVIIASMPAHIPTSGS